MHRIRAVDVQSVLRLIESVATQERIALHPASGELAVFAVPAVQQAVAEQIAAHEEKALLFERIDLLNADPHLVQRIVRSGIRAGRNDPSKRSSADSFRFEVDSWTKKFLVWGRASQIKFVKETIDALSERKAMENEAIAQTKRTAKSPAPSERERSTSGRESLLAPSGPIRIVPVKGADLLLIRGRRSDIEGSLD